MPFTTSTKTNANANAKRYIPPSMRNQQNIQQQSSPVAKKSALKKEPVYMNDNNAFPTLNDTMKSKNNQRGGTPISFSSALSKKKEEEKEVIVKDILTPGWCYIRHNKNNIQYKYGPQIVKEINEEKENMKLGRILFNYRIAREQYERDMDVERLGDLSEFYGEPTLEEIYENDIENDGENISYESSSSDSDYY